MKAALLKRRSSIRSYQPLTYHFPTFNVQEGFEFYQESKELMVKRTFNLRKWNSNSSVLLQLINNKEESVA